MRAAAALVVLLAACGGGGGGTTSDAADEGGLRFGDVGTVPDRTGGTEDSDAATGGEPDVAAVPEAVGPDVTHEDITHGPEDVGTGGDGDAEADTFDVEPDIEPDVDPCEGVVCDDGNPCTTDGCVEGSGCVYLADDALPCDDGDPCPAGDHCSAGTCLPGPCGCTSDDDCADVIGVVPDCTRAVCVGETCTLAEDPSQNGSECDDFDACTEGSICAGGVCSFGDPVDCSGFDQGPCAPGICDPGFGGCVVDLLANGTPCDDEDACTGPDVCSDGFCSAEPLVCEDGDVCNGVAVCDPEVGCVDGAPLDCDNGDVCDGVHTCDPVEGCVELEPPLTCDNGNVCDGVEVCHPTGGCLLGELPLDCDDGDACDGAEVCLPTQGCVEGTAPVCDDGVACNGLETCVPAAGCVDGTPPICTDDDICNGLESCDNAAGGCIDGTPLTCDDGNVCDGVESCDPLVGCVEGDPLVCNDGDPCNGQETCVADTGCVDGTPPDCGPFACGPTGCPSGCQGAADCLPGTFCDTSDVDGDGNHSECLSPAVDGGPCATASQCDSGYCDTGSGLCCDGGPICCVNDVGCPATADAAGPKMLSDTPLLFTEVSHETAAAQSFVPPWPGVMTGATVRIFGNPNEPLNLTVSVRSVGLPGEPVSVLLGSGAVEVTTLGDYAVTFDPPAHVTPGETHYLVVTGALFPPPDCGPVGCTTAFVLWYGSSDDGAYPEGEPFLSTDGGQSFFPDPAGGDRAFSTTFDIQGCLDNVCAQP